MPSQNFFSNSSPKANPLILWVFLLGTVSVPRQHLIGPVQLFISATIGSTKLEILAPKEAPSY